MVSSRCTFFNIVGPYVLSLEDIQEIQDSPSPHILSDLWLLSLAISTLVWFLSYLLQRTKDLFCQFSPTNCLPNEEWAKLVGLPSGIRILHR